MKLQKMWNVWNREAELWKMYKILSLFIKIPQTYRWSPTTLYSFEGSKVQRWHQIRQTIEITDFLMLKTFIIFICFLEVHESVFLVFLVFLAHAPSGVRDTNLICFNVRAILCYSMFFVVCVFFPCLVVILDNVFITTWIPVPFISQLHFRGVFKISLFNSPNRCFCLFPE